MERDMTSGNPGRILLNFTLPVFVGNVFQQFYSMVDTVVVGKFVGTNALAGVGATGTISFLIIGFLMGMSTGFTVLTSQRFGAGDMKGMRKTVASAAILSLIVSVVMTLVSVIGMHGLLKFLNTPDDIYDAAYSYIIIVCAGIVFQVLYNLLSSILRALGNSKTPLYFLILAALLNIVLDLVFIIAFHMGHSRSCLCNCDFSRNFRFLCLYYIIKKSAGFADGKGRLAYQLAFGKDPDEHWISHGVSVFHHCYRHHDRAVGAESAGLDCRSSFYSSQQDRADRDTGLCGAGNRHCHLCGPERGCRKGEADPPGISRRLYDGLCVCGGDWPDCGVLWKISDLSVYFR